MIVPLPYSTLDRVARGRPDLEAWLDSQPPYLAYTYSYPHKTAYRAIDPIPLSELWRDERRDALFLYLHVPFCESRCGYCNLFSHAARDAGLAEAYLDAIERQARQLRRALAPARFARVAIGGGTPTQLALPLLERLFDLAERGLGAALAELPVSLETSPQTAVPDKLALAAMRGVDRISIGVQSFDDSELRALGRRQPGARVEEALDQIRQQPFTTLNVDLIYGVAGQTPQSFVRSIEAALRWRPEELYLYPLYIRPLTGLGEARGRWTDRRGELYRVGRDLLLERGYRQLSMRMFRRADVAVVDGPVYRCQEDGMVGLGCGARSYTRGLHYSDEWAVAAGGVRDILRAWVERSDQAFSQAWYGYHLDDEDQRARYLLKSLLRVEGLDRGDYARCLGADALEHQPELEALARLGLVDLGAERIVPTALGLELSDCLGPWLYSERVRAAMEGFDQR